jgi:glutamine amidotransferase
MCRWLAYSGGPIFLEDLLFRPEHSLIDQSLEAKWTASTTNGDGFGVGWYGLRDFPGVYKDIQPAWNDDNLHAVASQVRSPMFLAHVRATTGTPVQRTNCHPFQHREWLFVHNGLIDHFEVIRRDLVMAVDPSLFMAIEGSTDSELMFFLALSLGLQDDPIGGLERMVGLVEDVAARHGVIPSIQMSVGMADGKRLYGVRYSTEGDTRTLFHSKSVEAIREINPELGQRLPEEARAVVSEPLTVLDVYWQEVAEATAVIVEDGEVTAVPFRPRMD